VIRLAEPAYLWLLLALPFLALLLGRLGGRVTLRYPSLDVARRVGRGTRSRLARWMPALRVLPLAALVVALARPERVETSREVQASGVDLVLAVDLSSSMNALDLETDGARRDRLAVVKDVVRDFIASRPGDRIGLVAFAGAPYLVSPPTLDHDWLLANLDRLQTGLVEDGTAIGAGLAASVDRLRDEPGTSKLVVLLTDGVNNAGKIHPDLAAEAASALGTKVYTVGVGTRGEAPTPVTDEAGNTRVVMAKVDVDEPLLRRIADATGGAFFRATDAESLRAVYDAIDRMEKTTRTIATSEQTVPLFHLAVLPAALLLAIELALRFTRLRRVP
jgi:Ca-activated chloride channel family protein